MTRTSVAQTALQGAVAGLVGTGVMTAFQRLVEMPITGREESYAPANLVTKLTPIQPDSGSTRRRLNNVAHIAVGAAWGVGHGLVARRRGLRSQPAVATVFAWFYAGDLVANTLLGLYHPWRWSAKDVAIDIVDKLVLAEAIGITFDRVRGA